MFTAFHNKKTYIIRDRLISHKYGEQKFKAGETPENFKDALADELADVFFVLTCIANEQEIDLEESIVRNMDKKYSRNKKRYISDSIA
jgi:NTP pyrophosphatase (non-canonical NTP hydrolase)